MGEPIVVDVCRTPDGNTQKNTVSVCLFCECQIKELVSAGKLKAGSSGEPVKRLHEHLKRFGMGIDLGEFKDGKPVDGADIKDGKWGATTTRALRLFASHPAVGSESESIIKSDGKSLSDPLIEKVKSWCRGKIISPQSYWEFKQLSIKGNDRDALGAQKNPDDQTILHDFVAQIERDLANAGFAAHDDKLCGLKRTHAPTGVFVQLPANKKGEHPADKDLKDISFLVRKFQRQAKWLWRMKGDGTHLPDTTSTDASVYAGAETGETDAATAKALHAWVEAGLHLVLNKFELADLHWPPDSTTPLQDADSKGTARLRKDAYDAWVKAGKEIATLEATIAGPYASSPRSWKGGKKTSAGASLYSWHYSALAVDLCQDLVSGDGGISDKRPYGLERDGTKFRIWCYASPQPATPAPADDKKDPLKQYRNRNIKPKATKGTANAKKSGDPTESNVLYFATHQKNAAGTDVLEVTAKEGWYVDVTSIMEKHGLSRIPRRAKWLTEDKDWEFWHYQFTPALPPGATAQPSFGEYLQIFGVHELQLRAVGWSSEDDIEHAIG